MLTNSLTPLRRTELASRIDEYRAASRRPIEWAWALSGIAGLAVGVLVMDLADRQGWPHILQPILFFSAWAPMINAVFVARRRLKRRQAAYQVDCPSCSKPLLNRDGSGRLRLAAEHVTLTGHCPFCDAVIAD